MLTGAGAGAAVGLLVALAWLAWSPGEEEPEVPETERLMGHAEMRGATGAGGISDAVSWLRQALELEPGNEQATAALARARSDAVQAIQNELAAGRPIVASGLLDIFESDWPGDRVLSDLRVDAGELFDELARAAELADILDRVEIDITAKRLRAPKEENAWDKLQHAEALIAESDRARRNWIEARRLQIASAYVKLVDGAIAQGSLVSAKRHVTNLEATVSDHPDRRRLEEQIDQLESARAASTAETQSPETPENITPSPAGPSAPVVADVAEELALLDPEDEFWADVKREYEKTENCDTLQRYNVAHPGGRFQEEYFVLKAQCDRRDNL